MDIVVGLLNFYTISAIGSFEQFVLIQNVRPDQSEAFRLLVNKRIFPHSMLDLKIMTIEV